MRRLKAFFIKDIMVLLRDKTGLLLLFVLPLSLVLVMTAMQDSAFSETAKREIPVVIVNKDDGIVGTRIMAVLENSEMFVVSKEQGLTVSQMSERVQSGEYKAGLYIPAHLSESVMDNIRLCVDGFFSGDQTDAASEKFSEQKVEVLFDPVVDASFKMAMSNFINSACLEVQKSFLPQAISEGISRQSIFPLPVAEMPIPAGVTVSCGVAGIGDDSGVVVNVAQHNVPAWTLFAIFFIAVSLAVNLISEKERGVLYRIRISSKVSWYMVSKAVAYLFVCTFQYLLIVAMGIWLFPLLGLPVFVPGTHFMSLFVVMLFAAIAAIGYGMLLGTLSTTQQQASNFGAISIVILSAVGGIWIPVFLMPKTLQVISGCSPLNWGIQACYDILLRDAQLSQVLPYCLLFLAMSLICFGVSFYLLQRQKNK